jgi:hypothetical protein
MPEGNKFKIDSSGSIVHENSSADSNGSRIPREVDLFGFVVDLKVFIVILATVLFFFRFKGCKHAICFHPSHLVLPSQSYYVSFYCYSSLFLSIIWII